MVYNHSRQGLPRSVLILGVFLIGLFITCTSTAEGTAEEETSLEGDIPVEESYQRFRSRFGGSYTAEVVYSAFSPHKGTWKLTVKERELRQWVFRDKENLPEYRDFAEKLTMAALYNRAAEDDTLEISYDESGMLSEIVLPSQGDGPHRQGIPHSCCKPQKDGRISGKDHSDTEGLKS